MIMRGQAQRRSPQVQDGVQTCQCCGGSGMLRLGDQSFRTCLDCLGQGRLPGREADTTMAPVLHREQVVRPSASRQPLNGAAAASSAAR